MDEFAVDGLWWLPESPTVRASGTLTFDADGIRLVLHGRIRVAEPSEPGAVVRRRRTRVAAPVVHGRAHDGELLTVLGASGFCDDAPDDFIVNKMDVDLALRGSHASSDLFTEVWFGFDFLDAWADPDSLVLDNKDGVDPWEAIRVRFGSVTLGEARLATSTIRLVAQVVGSAGGESVHLDRRTSFVAVPDRPMPASDIVEAFVRPLQDLLMFCVGAPVVLTTLRLQPAEQEDPRDGTASAHFRMIQRRSSGRVTVAAVENFDRPTVLSLRKAPLPFETLVTRWFERWTIWRDVLELLHGPLYAPFMFAEHGFSSTFQSAEALHDLVCATRDLSRGEHSARVEAAADVLAASDLSSADVEWAKRVLQSRNDKPLWRKIEDLLRSTGPVGDAVLTADPRFAHATTDLRAGVSHGGARSAADPAYRYWATQVLRWVVRSRLLMEVLDDEDAAQQRVAERHGFRLAVERIGEAATPTSGAT